MLTEAVFPVLLHEDPRYFRRGTGSTWRRLGYAVTRVVITQRDGGGSRFNASEWLGSATTVGIANAYYPDNRTLGGNTSRLFIASRDRCGVHGSQGILARHPPQNGK